MSKKLVCDTCKKIIEPDTQYILWEAGTKRKFRLFKWEWGIGWHRKDVCMPCVERLTGTSESAEAEIERWRDAFQEIAHAFGYTTWDRSYCGDFANRIKHLQDRVHNLERHEESTPDSLG